MTHKEKSKAALKKLGSLAARHEIKQQEIADLLCVRHQTVSQIFVGRFYPTLDTIFKYLEAINAIAGTDYDLNDVQP